jgi:cell division inhibitor SepF
MRGGLKLRNNWEEKENTGSKTGVFEKFLNLFGFEAEEVDEETESAAGPEATTSRKERNRRDQEPREREKERERGKLVTLANSNKAVKMIIVEPTNFDEVQTIVDNLKNRQTVILNLEDTDKNTARRIADFLSGAIYALDGSMQKVSGAIFLFTPPNIEVSIPIRTILKEKDKEKELERGQTSTSTFSSPLFRNDRER